MAILTNTGRSELVKAILEQPIFMAWGRADGTWTSPESEAIDATALQDVIGFRKATQVSYCEPDDNGAIEVSSGKFTLTNEQTRHLFLQFRFDFSDALGETIREIGVFLNTQLKAGLPEGQVYFANDEVTNAGQMLLLENYRPLVRDEGVRESFDFVVTF